MNKGFSLIELLFVLTMVGVLATIAYPNYSDYLTRTRRLEAQTALLDLASRMEQYHANAQTYQTATVQSALSPGGWYALSITQASARTYQLQATPMGVQAHRDTHCQSLTLSNTGIEGVAPGPAGAPTQSARHCW